MILKSWKYYTTNLYDKVNLSGNVELETEGKIDAAPPPKRALPFYTRKVEDPLKGVGVSVKKVTGDDIH